jgi:hypothetical protein
MKVVNPPYLKKNCHIFFILISPHLKVNAHSIIKKKQRQDINYRTDF